MNYRKTMKLGFVGFTYTPPKEITDHFEYLAWQINKAAELGCNVLHVTSPIPREENSLKCLKELLEKKNIELELGCPYEVFKLAGNEAKDARLAILNRIRLAKFLGVKILRNGFGRNVTRTSRFNKSISLQQSLEFIIKNLKEAAKIFEEENILYALENHCDFKGVEISEILREVNSPNIGCALDTANGFTVFCDPNDDIEALAKYTFTTHIKDMEVVDYPFRENLRDFPSTELIMFQPFGCAVGDGHVDIKRAIDLLEQQSPRADGLHLVVELGWVNYRNIKKDNSEYDKELVERSLDYIRKIILS